MKQTLCYSLTPLAGKKTRRLRRGWKEEGEKGGGGRGGGVGRRRSRRRADRGGSLLHAGA